MIGRNMLLKSKNLGLQLIRQAHHDTGGIPGQVTILQAFFSPSTTITII